VPLSRKKFSEHSARWQREAKRDGLSAAKWDKWSKLSAKSRKASDPREYAKGKPVVVQARENKQSTVYKMLVQVHGSTGRPATIRRGVSEMSSAQLNRVMNMSPLSRLHDYIVKQARRPVHPGEFNPFWYR
jgi:hypothetical protein